MLSRDQKITLEDNETNGLRDGEGAVARTADGALLMLYSHFEGGADHDRAVIAARRSEDNGLTWSERQVVFQPPGQALNAMSASLLPMQDGRLACIYLVKHTRATCLIPYFCASTDSGRTWSQPAPVTDEQGYFVVNNDRLIQLPNGRLVLPAAHHRRSPGSTRDDPDYSNAYCGCFLSDDAGVTWRKSRDWRNYQKDDWLAPADWDKSRPAVLEVIRERSNVLQEPGVAALGGNRLLGWARTLTYVYRSWSEDGGDTWSNYTALPDYPVPCSPQSIKPLADGRGLLMVFNDRRGIAFGSPDWHLRTPLSCAISHDGGHTWERVRPLESDNSRNYCYASLLLEPDFGLATYYVSGCYPDPDRRNRRRNLASLRVHIFDPQLLK